MQKKYSRQREAIKQYLIGNDTHPTADEVYYHVRQEYPNISLATVYRNLAQLKEAGRIRSVGTVAGQERFDADLHPHGHLVCLRCSAVEDLPDPGVSAELRRRAEDSSGWSVCGTSLRLTGLCPACRRTTS